MPVMDRKIDQLREKMVAADWRGALAIAAKFPRLGEHKTAILRAWEATVRPEFQRQIGRDPEQLIAAGIEALKARYPLEA